MGAFVLGPSCAGGEVAPESWTIQLCAKIRVKEQSPKYQAGDGGQAAVGELH